VTQQRDDGFELLQAVGAYDRPAFDPARAAVVIVDMVAWQLPATPVPGRLATPYYVDRTRRSAIPACRRIIDAAHEADVPVAFLRVGCFRTDYRDALPSFREHFRAAQAHDGSPSLDVIPELDARPGDLSLVKTGSSGFLTSNLHRHLQHMGVEHVIYAGVLTNACVTLTAAAGFDLGYHGYVATDATATVSEAMQVAAEQFLSGFIAQLITADDAVHSLTKAWVPRSN
jgi:nicotinamidase-related amidase